MGNASANRDPQVAVIGTGVIGAAVAWNLARQGARVVLLDAGRPGEGVTNWTFSWVNASNKTALESYFALNVAGLAAHRELAAAIGPESWWFPSGHLRWTDDPATEARNLATAALLTDWGYRAEVITGAEARRLEPALAIADGASAVFYPDEAWVHGRHLVERLVGLAVAAGAETRFGTPVRAIDTRSRSGLGHGLGHGLGSESGPESGPADSVRTLVLADGDTLDVDVVVNAAGPEASVIAGLVGRTLPMLWEPGAVTRIACDPVPIHRVMHAPHVEIRPDGDASVVLHSREVDARIDTGEEPAELARLLHASARHAVPALGDARIVATRVSNRPIPTDGFPSVGAVPGVPGYYEAVSHSGITLGPVLGRLLASEILGGEPDDLLADFRPARFAS